MADFDTPETDQFQFSTPELKKRHAEALAAFKVSASYFAPQRQREMEDLKFIDFGEQWDPQVKAQRAGNQTINGQPPTPPRPAITINQLRGPCQQVASQRRNARLSLSFAPKGNGATQSLAEAYDDIVRAIQAESRASIARNWAADRAEKAGLGWYRIDTEYSAEVPDDPNAWNDQDIVYRRILNQASVYPDPHAQEPDFSDGRKLFLTQDIPWLIYKAENPKSKLAQCDASELTGIGDQAQDFVFTASDTDSDQGKTIRIAEVWEVVENEREYVLLTNGKGAFKDDPLPEGVTVAIGAEARGRRVRERKVFWSKINAVEYLEEPREWNGSYIPIVPVIGEESNVNGERRWTGIVRPGKESAVSYNVMRSAQIEAVATGSKSPYIGYMETIEPYIEWWKNANLRNFPMLPVKAVKGPDGALLPMPQRNAVEPAIQAITLAAQAAKDDIHTTTGVPPVALGAIDPHERSGKAIERLQVQAETGSSGYLANLVDISMDYDGKVLRDLIPRIFDRPGRLIPAMGVDEKRRVVMVNMPYLDGPDGTIQAVPGWQPGMPIPKEATYIDLKAGKLSVQPVVGKAYATQRQATSAAVANVMQVVPPEMAAAMTPAWLEEQDYPGARKIADIAKKSLPPQLAKIYDEEEGSDIPPQAQQMIEQLKQQLQQATAEIGLEKAKEEATTQRELMKAQMNGQIAEAKAVIDGKVAIRKAEIDAATRLEVARINAQASLTEATIKAGTVDAGHQIQREEQLIGNDHELRVQARDHEAQQVQAEQAATVAAEGREAERSEAERSRQHERQMAAEQAAREPAEE